MVQIAIIGASGYTGAELVGQLLRHDEVELVALVSRHHEAQNFAELFPRYRGRIGLRFSRYSAGDLEGLDAVFLALPHGESAAIVPEIISGVKCVIDLGGDFRFADPGIYPQWYGFNHPAPELLRESVYALTEWVGDAVYGTRLIANPGCYPTGALLALLPLMGEQFVRTDVPIIVNSLSGVSGAGRRPSLTTHFSEVNESVLAYKIGQHQHTPEIEMGLRTFSATAANVTFTPHLLPITRGIFTTAFVQTVTEVGQDAVDAAFQKAYAHQPFVRYLGPESPRISSVAWTNFCDIGARFDPRTCGVVVMSAIDNLIKGAAGQAVQNLNRKFGISQTEGLLTS